MCGFSVNDWINTFQTSARFSAGILWPLHSSRNLSISFCLDSAKTKSVCLKEVIWRFYQCSERLWVQHTLRRSLQNHYNQSIWCFYHPVSSIPPPSAILKTSSLSFSQSSYHNCRTAIRLSKSFPWTLSLKTWWRYQSVSKGEILTVRHEKSGYS